MREDWNEKALSEDPAIHLLGELGYTYLEPFEVEPLREGARSSVLVKPLEETLKRLNPWLSDDDLAKAVRAVTTLGATSLAEANKQLYTTITRNASVTQDRGDGLKGTRSASSTLKNPVTTAITSRGSSGSRARGSRGSSEPARSWIRCARDARGSTT